MARLRRYFLPDQPLHAQRGNNREAIFFAEDDFACYRALFDGLGASPADRRKAYRELFRNEPDADFADALRAATNGGWALGDARFKRQIAKARDERFQETDP